MDDLNDYSQITFIYFYCSNENYYRSWKKNYKKVVGAFATEHELITQITSDVSSFFRNILPISVISSIDITEKSMQDLTKSQARFMWSQILMEILLDLPQTPESKQDFIDECRRRYKNNVSQQTKITWNSKKLTDLRMLFPGIQPIAHIVLLIRRCVYTKYNLHFQM